jgi:hypothetical protein
VFHAKHRSHEQRGVIRPSVHWLIQKTSDGKRDTSKMQRGSFERPPMKKEAPKMQMGSFKRPPMKKEVTKKHK